jgi:hypothetical protein
MNPAAWRLSDARFLLVLLLPAGTLLNVLEQPETAFWAAVATSVIVAGVDALWRGAQRSPAIVGVLAGAASPSCWLSGSDSR